MCYVEIILDLFYLIEPPPSVASDCYDVMMMGYRTDGRYTLTVRSQPMDFWCEIKHPDSWLVSNVKNNNSLQTEWKLRYERSAKIIITKYKKTKKRNKKKKKIPTNILRTTHKKNKKQNQK